MGSNLIFDDSITICLNKTGWVLIRVLFPSQENINKCKELELFVTTGSNPDYDWRAEIVERCTIIVNAFQIDNDGSAVIFFRGIEIALFPLWSGHTPSSTQQIRPIWTPLSAGYRCLRR